MLLIAFLIQLLQASTVKESIPYYSEILKTNVTYTIYLPNNYDDSGNTKYSIMYLFHGVLSIDTDYVKNMDLQNQADKFFEDKQDPFIIVTPNGFNSFYIDNFNQTFLYESFFFKEFMPYIEELYHVNQTKGRRAIGGLSMGGFGSGLYWAKHQDTFAVCCPMSGAFFQEGLFNEINPRILPDNMRMIYDLFGSNEYYLANNVQHIIKSKVNDAFKVPIRMSCGLEDELFEMNVDLHNVMNSKDTWHKFVVKHGKHVYDFWEHDLPEVFAFAYHYLDH